MVNYVSKSIYFPLLVLVKALNMAKKRDVSLSRLIQDLIMEAKE